MSSNVKKVPSSIPVWEKKRKRGQTALGFMILLGSLVAVGTGISGPQDTVLVGGAIGFVLGAVIVATAKKYVRKEGEHGVVLP